MQKTKFHTRFNPPPSRPVVFTQPTMTQQHFRDECDVNSIMKRYAQTGILPQAQGAIFADVAEYGDYREMLHKIMEVDSAFALLPSGTRAMFQNDPSLVYEFIANPANLDKAIELGLLPKPDVPRQEAPVVPPATDTAPQSVSEGPSKKDAGASS